MFQTLPLSLIPITYYGPIVKGTRQFENARLGKNLVREREMECAWNVKNIDRRGIAERDRSRCFVVRNERCRLS